MWLQLECTAGERTDATCGVGARMLTSDTPRAASLPMTLCARAFNQMLRDRSLALDQVHDARKPRNAEPGKRIRVGISKGKPAGY